MQKLLVFLPLIPLFVEFVHEISEIASKLVQLHLVRENEIAFLFSQRSKVYFVNKLQQKFYKLLVSVAWDNLIYSVLPEPVFDLRPGSLIYLIL